MKQEQIKKIFGQLADHEQRLIVLEQSGRNPISTENEKVRTKVDSAIPASVDFNVNARAFFKQHGSGLSGPKKFVLVLSYITHGSTEQEKTFENISNQWGKAEGLLGGKIQKMYATRAKEQDWIDSPKKSAYILRPKWSEIFM